MKRHLILTAGAGVLALVLVGPAQAQRYPQYDRRWYQPRDTWQPRWDERFEADEPYEGYGPRQIRQCVRRYLNRVAAPIEVHNWMTHFRDGGTYGQMLAAVLASDEYWFLRGGHPRALVIALYQDLLRRSPAHFEIQEWLHNWTRVGGDRRQFVYDFVNAALWEFEIRGYRI